MTTIAVFGATGKVGKMFIEKATQRNFKIRALARYAATIDPILDHAKLIKGEIFDPSAVSRVLHGVNAVLFVVGLRNNKSIPLLSLGIATVIEEMKNRGIERLVVVSEANYSIHIHKQRWIARLKFNLRKKWGNHALEERIKQDELILRSGLRYSVIRPYKLKEKASLNTPAYSFEPRPFTVCTSYQSLTDLLIAQFEQPEKFACRQIYL